MSRRDLINQLKKKNPSINKTDLETLVGIFSECITVAIKKSRNVEIRGLGRLYLKNLKENFNARNPKTNKLVYKPERIKVRFKPSQNLKKFINE